MQPEQLLYVEAALLDRRAYEEWLALFTEDALYWIPQRPDDDPDRDVAIVHEGLERLRDRVLRLRSGFAHSQDPPSRTCHLITNVQVTGDTERELVVHSNLLVVEARRNRQQSYAGPVEHTLVQTAEGLRIRRKVITLLNGDQPLGNVSFLI